MYHFVFILVSKFLMVIHEVQKGIFYNISKWEILSKQP